MVEYKQLELNELLQHLSQSVRQYVTAKVYLTYVADFLIL